MTKFKKGDLVVLRKKWEFARREYGICVVLGDKGLDQRDPSYSLYSQKTGRYVWDYESNLEPCTNDF